MDIMLLEKLGDGAFADVWRAKDELDRDVAVKIVRPAAVGVANALAHAKALARATHANVVSVLTLEKVTDPDSGHKVDCVVMELLHGTTLSKHLEGPKLTLSELRSIGVGIIDGLAHIHKQNMAHGDLHSDNVMVVDGRAKVIDILYLSTLASLSTVSKESKIKRDLISLRLLLQQMIVHSDVDSAEATEFNNLLALDANCDQMRDAFLQIVSTENVENEVRSVQHSFGRLTEAGFVEGETYASALDEDTPQRIILPLLKKIADEKIYESKHRHYVQAIWARSPASQRTEFLTYLSAILEAEVPKGRWSPGLRLLSALGSESWKGLSKLMQIKLEGQIINDTLAGHKDIHSTKTLNGGALGTYANLFWRHFKDKNVLAENLISLLRQNWYTQNYIATFFLDVIPDLANVTNTRSEFVSAFKIAVQNDARLIKNKLEDLPKEWVIDIRNHV